MSWFNVTAATKKQRSVELEDLFWFLGALSITIADGSDDPLYEPGYGETPIWPDVHMSGLFSDELDIIRINEKILTNGFSLVGYENLLDRVWEREWLKYFEPTQFGRRLWICPNGMDVSDDEAVIVNLDPGLAFGTGSHSTTRLCLEWLSEANLRESSLLDFGCGSGVLAIAAYLLGARNVVAIDNDPQAIAATEENAKKNKASDISALLGHKPLGRFDIVIANILSEPLIALSELLKRSVLPRGSLVLSGIMESQRTSVLQAYKSFEVCNSCTNDGWELVHLKNPTRE